MCLRSYYACYAHLGKHLSDQVPDDKATHVIPATTGVAGKLASEKTQTPVSGGSVRRNIKATVLTFRVIVDRPNMARVQLLLCNISDRALYFKLKSNVGSNVSALPSGDGEIPPHAQVRLVLTWTRPSNYQHWREVPSPKLLITTRFMDSKSDSDASTTSIRLIARVSTSKTCHASNPPVEQLLLDAVGKTENMEVSSVMHDTVHTPDKGHETRPHDESQAAATNVASMLNGLDDRGLFILVLILLTIMYTHLHEELPLEKSALEFMMSSFPEVKEKEEMRKIVGRYGITGREQVCPMKQLSDGQRCRVSFAWLAWQQPHLLLLDEPTNHLDMESIDALAEALNCFPGGMILVSHDFRLVSQVAGEVWVCDNQTITKWDGDIFSYKDHLRHQIDREFRAREKGLTKER
ncbi:unnamed protein product [Angiostrongylus costaricensis]|uniref:ABC transporter domain-containing protein n=1 Tax=Angiostrongylus costaricensis TaxID=334426 RepID=A0A158PJU5_ANGCS|nr:unnamed protein product [Angiostrongylus costaricensis]